jgi:hypothetical protein
VALQSMRASLQQRSPTFWLLVVSGAYLAAQILLFDETRYLEWDEAEYWARSSAQIANPEWLPHRALGVVWIISPVTLVGGSLVMLRWYLIVASTLAVGLAFSRWIRLGGIVAPISMAIFVSSWLALFYGSEMSPNLYVAAAAVGAVGSLATYATRNRGSDLIWLASFVAVAFMLRPSDAAVLCVALGLAALFVLKPAEILRTGFALLAGVAIGVAPWVIESYQYFGGPFERLEAASELVGGGITFNVLEHLLIADGPLVGPDRLRAVSVAVVLVVAISGRIAVFGLGRSELRPAVLVAFGIGVLMALPYLVYMEALAPRFLLPSMALMSIPIGMGLLGLLERHRRLGVIAVGFLLVSSVWSASVALSVHQHEFEYREIMLATGTAMAERTDAGACHFLSMVAMPSIVVETGCEGQHLFVDQLRCQAESIQSQAPERDILIVLNTRRVEAEEFEFLTPIPDSGVPSPLALFNIDAGSDTGCRSV